MSLSCPDAVPTLLNLFAPGIAPHLLYYAYLPIIVVSMFFGLFIYYKAGKTLLGKYLLIIAIIFSLFLLNEIVQWIAVPASLVYFSWSIAPLFQISVWFFTINFFYLFFEKKQFPFKWNVLLAIIILPIMILLVTRSNIIYFDLANCQAGKVGFLWYYLYAFQILSTVCLLVWGIIKSRSAPSKKIRNQILLLAIGVSFFLSVFSLSNILGEVLKTYDINLIGPIGMALFIGLLAYLIVRYKVFNIQLLSAEALVVAMVVLIGSQFFFVQNVTNIILTGITLGLISLAGWWLARSVKIENEQRQEIEALAGDLKVANVRLKELDVEKDNFLSMASHELNTPLAAIKGYLSMILDEHIGGELSATHKKYLSNVNVSAKRLAHLVKDLLNVSRIKQHRIHLIYSEIDVNALIEQSVAEVKPNVDQMKHTLTVHLDKNMPKTWADGDRVQEMVINLLGNSIKYTDEGGKIEVHSEHDAKNILIYVKDNGMGIDKEHFTKIFGQFEQGDISRDQRKGTGLGLFIVKNLVDLHGGRVWVDSEGVGKGSTFHITLPIHREKPADTHEGEGPVLKLQ